MALFLLSVIDTFKWFWMGRLQYINDFPDDVICNIAIYADDTLYSNCDQVSDLWQQLELASELEPETGV